MRNDIFSAAYAKKFTVRRMYESAREELEKVELLREVSISCTFYSNVENHVSIHMHESDSASLRRL